MGRLEARKPLGPLLIIPLDTRLAIYGAFFSASSEAWGRPLWGRSVNRGRFLVTTPGTITLSSKDGCFQAHLLVVIARSLSFPLSDCLGTLDLSTLKVCLYKRSRPVFGVSLGLVRRNGATLAH